MLVEALAGCPNLVKPKPSIEDTSDIEERSNLFVPDEDNPGTFRFLTNNPDFWSERGFTLWASTGNEQNLISFKVTVTKQGICDKYAGYGIVLCQYETGDPQQARL
ncbi:MAG: hypothetical protein MZV49_09285 [Rhodopseudomonas palustris]|nr:hypothetical protein [Rhodopseudomonas palustris]